MQISSQLCGNMSLVHMELGEWTDAKWAPNELSMRAVELGRLGKDRDALPLYQRALKWIPKDDLEGQAQTLSNIPTCHNQLQEFKESEDAVTRGDNERSVVREGVVLLGMLTPQPVCEAGRSSKRL